MKEAPMEPIMYYSTFLYKQGTLTEQGEEAIKNVYT